MGLRDKLEKKCKSCIWDLKYCRDYVSNEYNELTSIEKVYVLGFIAVVIMILVLNLNNISNLLHLRELIDISNIILVTMSIVLFAFLCDIWEKLSNFKLLTVGFISFVGVVIYYFVKIFVLYEINKITKVDPKFFTNSEPFLVGFQVTNYLSNCVTAIFNNNELLAELLAAIYLASILFLSLFKEISNYIKYIALLLFIGLNVYYKIKLVNALLLIILYVYILFFSKKRNILKFGRFLSISCIIVVSFSLHKTVGEYGKRKINTDIILATEYFKKTPCNTKEDKDQNKNQGNDFLVATLNDGYISIYNEDTDIFRTEKCKRKQ